MSKTMQTTGATVHHFIAKDFSVSVRRALTKAGITVIGCCVIPGDGPMGYANGSRGYQLSNNGQGQVRTYAEVIALGGKTS